MPRFWLNQSVVLDINWVLLLLVHLLSGSLSHLLLLLLFGSLLGGDRSELLVMLLDLPGVDLLLELLGLGFLLNGANL